MERLEVELKFFVELMLNMPQKNMLTGIAKRLMIMGTGDMLLNVIKSRKIMVVNGIQKKGNLIYQIMGKLVQNQ